MLGCMRRDFLARAICEADLTLVKSGYARLSDYLSMVNDRTKQPTRIIRHWGYLSLIVVAYSILGCAMVFHYRISKVSEASFTDPWGADSLVDLPGVTMQVYVNNAVSRRDTYHVPFVPFPVKTADPETKSSPRPLSITLHVKPKEAGYSFNPERARIILGDEVISVVSVKGFIEPLVEVRKPWIGRSPTSYSYFSAEGRQKIDPDRFVTLMEAKLYLYELQFAAPVSPEREFILDLTEALQHVSSRNGPLLRFKGAEYKYGIASLENSNSQETRSVSDPTLLSGPTLRQPL